MCVRDGDFSFIVPPLDDDKRLFLRVSSKDFYFEKLTQPYHPAAQDRLPAEAKQG